MTDNANKTGVLTIVLFAIYALLLAGIILFKFPFQYQLVTTGRDLNLIPFSGTYSDSRGLGIGEVVENVLIFIPLGVYLSMLARRRSFGLQSVTIAGTSIAFEVIQYAFAIGHADITDVICNTAGGIAGIGLYALVARGLKTKTNLVLNIAELIVTVVALAFFVFLRAHSR